MAKTAFEGPRRSLFLLNPEAVVIIGLDTDDGPNHPLYDERIHLPLNEATVLDIMKRGVVEPISVKKDGDRALVADGRRRTMHAREVNRRIRQAGGTEFIKIPVLPPEKGTDSELMGLMFALNEHREADTALTRAKKIQRYMKMGHDDKQTAQTFNISVSTLNNTLSLLDLVPELQTKLTEGEIGLTQAYAVARLSSEDQIKSLDRPVKKPTVSKGPTRSALKALAAKGDGKLPKDFIAGLRYALGEIGPSEIDGLTDLL